MIGQYTNKSKGENGDKKTRKTPKGENADPQMRKSSTDQTADQQVRTTSKGEVADSNVRKSSQGETIDSQVQKASKGKNTAEKVRKKSKDEAQKATVIKGKPKIKVYNMDPETVEFIDFGATVDDHTGPINETHPEEDKSEKDYEKSAKDASFPEISLPIQYDVSDTSCAMQTEKLPGVSVDGTPTDKEPILLKQNKQKKDDLPPLLTKPTILHPTKKSECCAIV